MQIRPPHDHIKLKQLKYRKLKKKNLIRKEDQVPFLFLAFTYDFGYGEANSNGGISKRHYGSENWEPGELMKVWYLAKNNLDAGKDDHEWIVWCVALDMVTMSVEAIWPFNSPDNNET